MVRLKDIAAEANVSVMTVSNVVNGNLSKVSKEKADEIQAILRKRNYVQNASARSLAKANSNIVAIMLRNIENENSLSSPHNATLVGIIIQQVQALGYYAMVSLVQNKEDISRNLRTWNVRGAIFLGMFDDEIERICEVDPLTGKVLNAYTVYVVYPASGYATKQEIINRAANTIEEELADRLQVLENEGKLLEKQRLEQRARYDIEALREFGVCPGIENYSRHIDGRKPGERPYTLFDYFPDDFLLVVDESHVSLPQIRGMYNGDRARKETLVNYGFRLPSALDNRPMRFEEFEKMINQAIFVSATPGNYELEQTKGEIIEQIIRPTGLLDPVVTVRPTQGQIDDLVDEIRTRIEKNERTLITTLTVRMAEDLTSYLKGMDFKVAWLHHEVKTIERTEIIRDLRKGKYDVLIGINLLREGLDIPEVSLITILDADKEGFLRSERSLIQIIGRAARNAHGQVIMYADKITDSMQKALDETARRREIQIAYNEKHGITPKTIIKPIHEVVRSKETQEMTAKYIGKKAKVSKKDKEKLLANLEKEMREAAKVLDFERAAELRDILLELRNS